MNKFLGKKGQGAMEYLMTYGWAILVVMIVGVVLWQLGIFNLGGTVSKTMSGFGAVKPIEWAMRGTTDDDIVVVNGEGVAIIFPAGSVTVDCAGGSTFAAVTGLTTSAGALPQTLAAGDAIRFSGGFCSGSPGASHKIALNIGYTKAIGGVTQTHSSVGTLRGAFE